MTKLFQTLITGCDLYLPDGRNYHGDLWFGNGNWIFNAVVDKEGQAIAGTAHEGAPNFLRVLHGVDYWERRGVFILPTNSVKLSAAAAAYIRKWSSFPPG